MYKKIFLGIAILISYNTKIHSQNFYRYTWDNSCKPTIFLTSLICAGIFVKEQDKDLILPLAGTVALSTVVSGISCFSSLFINKTISLWNCSDNCPIQDISCKQHTLDDSILQNARKMLYKNSDRIGTFAGLLTTAYLFYHCKV